MKTESSENKCGNIMKNGGKDNVLYDLIKMQRKYDRAVMDRKNDGHKPELWQMVTALRDEMGETVHALKKEWCYWKKSQEQTNWDDVQEELADIMHFVFSILQFHYDQENEKTEKEVFDLVDVMLVSVMKSVEQVPVRDAKTIAKYIDWMDYNISTMDQHKTPINILYAFYALAYTCGYKPEDMANAYQKKHKINWERLNSNY